MRPFGGREEGIVWKSRLGNPGCVVAPPDHAGRAFLLLFSRARLDAYPPLILALLGALLLVHLQKPSYQATSEVGASRATVVPVVRTQQLLARSPELAARVIAAADVRGMTPGKLLAASAVIPTANPDFDLLQFSVSDPHPRTAVLLANTYASEFAALIQKRSPLEAVVFQSDERASALRTHTLRNSLFGCLLGGLLGVGLVAIVAIRGSRKSD